MAPPDPQPDQPIALDDLNPVNAGYVAQLYEQYRADPSRVDATWRAYFESGNGQVTPPTQAARAAEAPATATTLPEGAQPIKGPGARLARNMAASLAVPTATSFREIDVAALEAHRRELNGQLAPSGRKVSFTHLIGWAIVRAAGEQMQLTHYFTEVEGEPY